MLLPGKGRLICKTLTKTRGCLFLAARRIAKRSPGLELSEKSVGTRIISYVFIPRIRGCYLLIKINFLFQINDMNANDSIKYHEHPLPKSFPYLPLAPLSAPDNNPRPPK